jgi:hypothetical protein
MCNYFSAIVTRDLKVHWSKKTCRHEDIIAELKLADTKLVDRDFVRVEITPNNKEKLTRNRADWTYKVDEDDTVPAWYKKAEAIIQASIWVNWSESAKTQIVIDSESIEVTDTYLLVQSSSKVVARGSSTVVARDSSTVVAWNSSTVVARDSSTVEAWDSSTVEAWDSSTVEAWDSSKVVARDYSTVVARDYSKVEARGSSTVVARDSSTVEAWDSSKVVIKSSNAVALCHGKIIVNKQATVIIKESFNATEISY